MLDGREAVYRLALDSPRLTEDGVVRALRDSAISAGAVEAIARHPRWSPRREVRLAIVRSPGASLARVLATVEQIARRDLAELAEDESMPRDRRRYLAWLADGRKQTAGGRKQETGGRRQTAPASCILPPAS